MCETGTVSVLFALEIAGLIIMVLSYFCHKKMGYMLAERCGLNMQSFFLWGTIINVILMAYLPMLMATFISTVGIEWGDQISQPVLLSNLWTIFMMCAWIICPIFLFFILWGNRDKIGQKNPNEQVGRDASKVKWKKDWAKIS